jgi:hypothetical protein
VHLARKSVESGVEAVDLALTVISTLAASQGMSAVELASLMAVLLWLYRRQKKAPGFATLEILLL